MCRELRLVATVEGTVGHGASLKIPKCLCGIFVLSGRSEGLTQLFERYCVYNTNAISRRIDEEYQLNIKSSFCFPQLSLGVSSFTIGSLHASRGVQKATKIFKNSSTIRTVTDHVCIRFKIGNNSHFRTKFLLAGV